MSLMMKSHEEVEWSFRQRRSLEERKEIDEDQFSVDGDFRLKEEEEEETTPKPNRGAAESE